MGQVNHMDIKLTAITSNKAKSPFLFGIAWFYLYMWASDFMEFIVKIRVSRICKCKIWPMILHVYQYNMLLEIHFNEN